MPKENYNRDTESQTLNDRISDTNNRIMSSSNQLNSRIDDTNHRITESSKQLNNRITESSKQLNDRITDSEKHLNNRITDNINITKWMFNKLSSQISDLSDQVKLSQSNRKWDIGIIITIVLGFLGVLLKLG